MAVLRRDRIHAMKGRPILFLPFFSPHRPCDQIPAAFISPKSEHLFATAGGISSGGSHCTMSKSCLNSKTMHDARVLRHQFLCDQRSKNSTRGNAHFLKNSHRSVMLTRLARPR